MTTTPPSTATLHTYRSPSGRTVELLVPEGVDPDAITLLDLDPRPHHLADLQCDVAEWRDRELPGATVPRAALVLCEEAGEVARCVAKADQGIRTPEGGWTAALGRELADTVIAALGVAESAGLDLDHEVWARWSEVSRRRFATAPTTTEELHP